MGFHRVIYAKRLEGININVVLLVYLNKGNVYE